MGRAFLVLVHLILQFASAAKSSGTEAGVNGSIFIPLRFLESNRNKSSGLQDSNVRALETLTLDERCKMGRPLSLAWYQYPPYTINQEARLQSTEEPGLVIQGMLPDILRDILESCCNKTSRVSYGKLVESSWQINDLLQRGKYDFGFPVHIFDDASRSVRGRPFVAIVQAPRVVLLVLDESPGESQDGFIVFLTISHAWPMLAFLLLMALLASVIIWFLDHSRNPQEFPPSFLTGVWEGFWWALVTMTTVGYGDRSPKSFVGRLFSIVWILGGVCLLSIFTALVSSSLSASTQPNYKKHGAVIGAVNGSNEYRLGVTLNADMQVFSHVEPMILTLSRSEIDGALVDNYVITHHLDLLSKHPIRIEEQIKYPVTYGVALAQNSSGLETCARRYIRDHPQEVFETFSKHLRVFA